jgi:hypothetical protein
VPNTLNVTRAVVNVESVYVEPQFDMFRDTTALMRRLFVDLRGHGTQLSNMSVGSGTTSVAEENVICNLYDFRASVRVYADKVSVVWANLLNTEIEKFSSLFVSALTAVKGHQPQIEFRSHTMNLQIHGALEGQPAKEYLAAFLRNVPDNLDPRMGSGFVIYFGLSDDRLLSTFTLDLSVEVSGGLFVRQYVVWDGSKVAFAALPARATTFFRRTADAFGLEIPSLRMA